MSFRFGLTFASSLLAAACTNAPATEEGGDPRFNPSPPSSTPGDAGGDSPCGDPNADAGSGERWSDLYRDYFGPTGAASCAGTAGACHGEPTALGAQSSNYVCAGGASGCYTGITSPSAGLVTPGDTKDSPTNSTLYVVLRKACGGGTMPKQPASYSFRAADLSRITAWIGAGAPNN